MGLYIGLAFACSLLTPGEFGVGSGFRSFDLVVPEQPTSPSLSRSYWR